MSEQHAAGNDAGPIRLFDVPAKTVIAGVGCVWCCVEVGEPCRERDREIEVPHAQRWREHHNATHGAGEQVPIFTPWGHQVNRIRRTSPIPPGSTP